MTPTHPSSSGWACALDFIRADLNGSPAAQNLWAALVDASLNHNEPQATEWLIQMLEWNPVAAQMFSPKQYVVIKLSFRHGQTRKRKTRCKIHNVRLPLYTDTRQIHFTKKTPERHVLLSSRHN